MMVLSKSTPIFFLPDAPMPQSLNLLAAAERENVLAHRIGAGADDLVRHREEKHGMEIALEQPLELGAASRENHPAHLRAGGVTARERSAALPIGGLGVG